MRRKLHFLLLSLLFPTIGQAAIQIVTVSNNVFTPSSFTISVGDTVRWVWQAGGHTTTSTSVPSGAMTWNAQLNGSPSTTTFDYPVCIAGSYSYVCTPHAPAMAGSFTATCVNPPAPTVSAPSANPTICTGQSVVLTTPQKSCYSYQWKLNGNNVGSNSNTYTATAAGTYTVTVTNSCNSSTSSNFVIGTGTPPVITATHSLTQLCAGQCDSVTLTSSIPGTTYTFTTSPLPTQNPVTGSSFVYCNPASPNNLVGTTNVVVTGTAPSGCTGTSASTTVTGLLTPKPSFTFTKVGNTYTFTNTSQDTGASGTTWVWNFGDATPTVTTKNAVHTYTTFGPKNVTLKATNSNGCSTTSAPTQVTPTSVGALAALGNVSCYPNPASGRIVVAGLSNGRADLIDASGRLVATAIAGAAPGVILDVRSLSAGFYLLRVQNASGTATERVSIVR